MKTNKLFKYILLLALLTPFKARANEIKNPEKNYKIYATVNQSDVKPKEYNKEIKRISLGDVYGPVSGYGIGLEKKVLNKFWVNAKISQNSQKVDSIQKDLQTNENIVFGYNKLTLTYADLITKYVQPIFKNKKKTIETSLELGAGLATTTIDIETSNGIETRKSNTITFGTKLTTSLSQRIKDFFIRGTYSKRMGTKADNFNASCNTISGEAGVYFK